MRNYYFNYNQAIVNPFKFKKNAKKKPNEVVWLFNIFYLVFRFRKKKSYCLQCLMLF